MKNLFVALTLVSCFLFAACGGEGGGTGGGGGGGDEPAKASPVGTWTLDTDAVKKALDAKMKEDPTAAGPMGPMIKTMLDSMQMDCEMTEDGNWVGTMKMKNPMSGAEETSNAKGTWKLDGDKISMTTTEEDGKAKASPDVEMGTFKGDVIEMKSKEGQPFEMIMRRK